MYDILVRDTQDADGYRMLTDSLTDHRTQSTKLTMLLNGDETTCLLGGFQDCLSVEGLDP